MQVIETKVYQFDELDDSAKESARGWYRQGLDYPDWADFVLDDANTIAAMLGIEIATRPVKLMGGGTRNEPVIYYSGFSSQGDGACFEGYYYYKKGSVAAVKKYAPQDTRLHQIAESLYEIQRAHFYQLSASIAHTGRYYHAYSTSINVERDSDSWSVSRDTEESLSECLRDFMNWIYAQLESEWRYMNSDEIVDESIRANEYTFTEDGARFG